MGKDRSRQKVFVLDAMNSESHDAISAIRIRSIQADTSYLSPQANLFHAAEKINGTSDANAVSEYSQLKVFSPYRSVPPVFPCSLSSRTLLALEGNFLYKN